MREMTSEEIERVWLVGHSGRDDAEALRAGSTASNEIKAALAAVRAAGYRVTKKPKPKHKSCSGPVFEAEFSDGTRVRMSVFSSLENLDWNRGERVARQAWASRHKVPLDRDSTELARLAPFIRACQFEQNDKVLARRKGGRAA